MPQKGMFSSQKVLATYVDDMITEKMGENLDQKARGELRRKLLEELDQAFQRGMIEALPDAQLVELNEKLDQDASEAELEKVFVDAQVNYDAVMLKVLKAFRAEYLSTASVAETAEAQPLGTVNGAEMAEAQPAQGTTSEAPGQSDVEGVAINQEER